MSLQEYLEDLNAPVLTVDGDGRVLAANRAACAALSLTPERLVGRLCGDVFECAYARRPEGCGRTEHCLGCTIRRAVTRAAETGEASYRLPAKLKRDPKGQGHVDLLVSAELAGDVVLLRVELADSAEVAQGIYTNLAADEAAAARDPNEVAPKVRAGGESAAQADCRTRRQMSPNCTLLPYEPGRDAEGVHSLWAQTLGEAWPISLELFGAVLSEHAPGVEGLRAGHSPHWVVVGDGQIVGFASTQGSNSGPSPAGPVSGGLTLLLVSPAMQGQGIGSTLHDAALHGLAHRGVDTVHLGSGGRARFWPGVPPNLRGAKDFFLRRGWAFAGTSWDLAMPLCDGDAQANLDEARAEESALVRLATESDVGKVLDFELQEFAGWYPYFLRCAEAGHYCNILAAWDKEGAVLGSLLMSSPDKYYSAHQVAWQGLLGEKMGAIGSVGVRREARGQGIGIALVAEANRLLRGRGLERGFIGWTTLVDWYGKVGYRPWRSYDMGQTELRSGLS